MLKYVDNLIYPSLKLRQNNLRKARLIVSSCLIVIVFCFLYLPLYLYQSYYEPSIILIVGAVLATLLIFIFWRTQKFIFAGNYFTAVAFLFFTSFMSISKGLFSAEAIWLISVPISAFLLANQKSGFVWSGITFLALSLFYILDINSYEFVPFYHQSWEGMIFFLNISGAIMYIVLMTQVYEKGHQLVNTQLQAANDEIFEKNHELALQVDTIDRQTQELTQTLDKINSSIRYAERIQKVLLPQELLIKDSFEDVFILFKPKDVVSGDFYWFSKLGDKNIIIVADCTGHGIPGAFMAMVGNDFLNLIINEQKITEPDLILNSLHNNIRKTFKQAQSSNRDGMDISICVIDKKQNTLDFAGAKSPLVYIQNKQIHYLKGNKHSIGGLQKEESRFFTKHRIDISVPTTFYTFSDGYQDQFGGELNTKFMSRKFRQLLFDKHQLTMPAQKESLEEILKNWKGSEEQVDDILVLGVKV